MPSRTGNRHCMLRSCGVRLMQHCGDSYTLMMLTQSDTVSYQAVPHEEEWQAGGSESTDRFTGC